jgi:hypothetical protein
MRLLLAVMLLLTAACRSMDQTDGTDRRRIETEVLAFLSHYVEADDHTDSGVTTLLLEKQRGEWHVLEGHSSTSGGPPSR